MLMTVDRDRSRFRLAMVQMRVDAGSSEENVARAKARIAEAFSKGAQVILLPEAFTLGWTHPSAGSKAESIPAGKACEELSQCSRQNRCYICAGLVERSGSQIFNAAIMLGPDGELLIHHRKINELEIG